MKWNEVHPKVGAGALGGALAGVLTWALDAFVGVGVVARDVVQGSRETACL